MGPRGTFTLTPLVIALALGCAGDDGDGRARQPGTDAILPPGIALRVAIGPASPAPGTLLAGQTGAAVLQIEVRVAGRDVTLDRLRLHASGTGDDAADIAAVRLYHDLDGDGAVDPGEPQLASRSGFTRDDGEVNYVLLGLPLPALATEHYLIIYDMDFALVGGDDFCLEVRDPADVTAEITTTGDPAIVDVTPGIAACHIARGIELIIDPGPSNPQGLWAPPGSVGETVLHAALTTRAVDVDIDELTIQASGFGQDAWHVLEARLYHDVDGDGSVGAADVPLGAPMTYTVDNGTLDFTGLGATIPARSTVHWLLAYDISAYAGAHAEFCAGIPDSSYVTAAGPGGAPAIVVTRPDVEGCVDTGFVTFEVFAGPRTPGTTQASPGSTGISVIQVLMGANYADTEVSRVRFHAYGSGDDGAHVAGAWLYHDVDNDGLLSAPDQVIAGPITPTGDDGDIEFTGLSEVFGPGAGRWLLVYDIDPGASPGDEFCARIDDGSDVSVWAPLAPPGVTVVEPGIEGCVTIP